MQKQHKRNLMLNMKQFNTESNVSSIKKVLSVFAIK